MAQDKKRKSDEVRSQQFGEMVEVFHHICYSIWGVMFWIVESESIFWHCPKNFSVLYLYLMSIICVIPA